MTQERYRLNAEKATLVAHVSISLRQRVENLAIQREVWETTQFAGSNLALYQILDECLVLYRELTTGKT